MLSSCRTSTCTAVAVPPARAISRATVVIVEEGEFGLGGKGEGRSEGGVVDLAATTTEGDQRDEMSMRVLDSREYMTYRRTRCWRGQWQFGGRCRGRRLRRGRRGVGRGAFWVVCCAVCYVLLCDVVLCYGVSYVGDDFIYRLQLFNNHRLEMHSRGVEGEGRTEVGPCGFPGRGYLGCPTFGITGFLVLGTDY